MERPTLNSMNNLASLYRSKGQYNLALPLYKECLEKTKVVLGAEHPDYISRLEILLYHEILHAIHQFDLLSFYLCISILYACIVILFPLYSSCNFLAGLYKSQGKFQLSFPLMLECAEKNVILYGADHPFTLLSKSNLAMIYENLGFYLSIYLSKLLLL